MRIFRFLGLPLICLGGLWGAHPGMAQSPVNPPWIDGYPLYEVFPRAFSSEGTFKALEGRLPELKTRGFQNLWLMPIYPIGEVGRKGSLGSPYAVRDYFEVNPEYGSKEDFAALVSVAHRLDMKIMLDMVINHSANDHLEMTAHPDWFYHDSSGAFSREVADWSDVTDWNFANPGARAYLDSALLYWAQEYDVDGYRCDVAGMVPDDFWQGIIPRLQALKADFFMLAEWESPQMHLDGFNATYDWSLYHAMIAHHEEKITLDSLWQVIEARQKDYPTNSLPLRFIENHDQERAASVFGLEASQAYAALIFTLPGIPLVYNGQEIGADHRPTLFEKDSLPWQSPNAAVEELYRQLLELRHQLLSLRDGGLKRLPVEPAKKTLAFLRTCGSKSALVLINFSDQTAVINLSPEFAGTTNIEVVLEPYGYRVLSEELTGAQPEEK